MGTVLRRGWSIALLLIVPMTMSACGSSTPATVPAPNANFGSTSSRVIPNSILNEPLTNQHGQPVTLNSFKGKTVLLVPFLTLCADICPLTTGNLYQVQRALARQNAEGMVQVVELSVDPGRDNPARLAAYATLTGAKWQLVTESPATLSKIAKYFGFYYQKIAQDSPPSKDWMTGKPLTYDIDHSDGYVVISPSGVEKYVTAAAPQFNGKLNPVIYRFLSEAGLQHLKHEPGPSYVPANILAALSWSMQMKLRP